MCHRMENNLWAKTVHESKNTVVIGMWQLYENIFNKYAVSSEFNQTLDLYGKLYVTGLSLILFLLLETDL